MREYRVSEKSIEGLWESTGKVYYSKKAAYMSAADKNRRGDIHITSRKVPVFKTALKAKRVSANELRIGDAIIRHHRTIGDTNDWMALLSKETSGEAIARIGRCGLGTHPDELAAAVLAIPNDYKYGSSNDIILDFGVGYTETVSSAHLDRKQFLIIKTSKKTRAMLAE